MEDDPKSSALEALSKLRKEPCATGIVYPGGPAPEYVSFWRARLDPVNLCRHILEGIPLIMHRLHRRLSRCLTWQIRLPILPGLYGRWT
jgi:hypothetical protein